MLYKFLGYDTQTIIRTLNTNVEEGLRMGEARQRRFRHLLSFLYSRTALIYLVLPTVFIASLLWLFTTHGNESMVMGYILLYLPLTIIFLFLGKQKKRVNVVRENRVISLPLQALVAGDIVELSAKQEIPTLLRLCSGTVYIDESALFGPSHESIKKDASLNTKEVYLLAGSKLLSEQPIRALVVSNPQLQVHSWWNSRGMLLIHLCWNIVMYLMITNSALSLLTLVALSPLLPNLVTLLLKRVLPSKHIYDRHIIPLRTYFEYDYKNASVTVGQKNYTNGQTKEPVASFLDTISLGVAQAEHSVLQQHLEKLQVHFPSLTPASKAELEKTTLLTYTSGDDLANGAITFSSEDGRIFSISEPQRLLAEANYLWDGTDPFGKRSFNERNLRPYAQHLIDLQETHLIIGLSYLETATRGSKTINSTVYVGHISIPYSLPKPPIAAIKKLRKASFSIGLYTTLPSYQYAQAAGLEVFTDTMDFLSDTKQTIPLLARSALRPMTEFINTKIPNLQVHHNHTPIEDFTLSSETALKSHILLYVIASYLASAFSLALISLFFGTGLFTFVVHMVHMLLLLFVYTSPMGGIAIMKQRHTFKRKLLVSLLGATFSFTVLYGFSLALSRLTADTQYIGTFLPFALLLGALSGYIIHIFKRSVSPLMHFLSVLCIILCSSIPFYYIAITLLPLSMLLLLSTLALLFILLMLLLSGKKEVAPKKVFPFLY